MMGRSTAGSVVVGVALGAAIAALGYRYGVLPWSLETTGATALTGVGIAMIVATLLARRLDPAPSWVARGIGAVLGAAVVLTIAFPVLPTFDRLPLEHHELPGFSIALPEGSVDGTASEYGEGELRVRGDGGAVTVAWRPTTPGGAAPRDPAVATLRCGGRTIMIAIATDADAARLKRRMLATFRCNP